MKQKKIHTDKKGRDFIKQSYFIGGKMKINKIYVIDGIPVDEYYERNATDIEFHANGDYWMMGRGNKNEAINDDDELPF